MNMQQPKIHRGPDPQSSIAVPKQPLGAHARAAGNRICLGSPVLQLCDSVMLGNQDSTVIALDKRKNQVRRVCHAIEFGPPRLPLPKASLPCGPQVASAILV